MTTPTTEHRAGTTSSIALEAAIEAIRDEVARYGKPTPRALRLRITSGMDMETYKQAIREGLARYEGNDPRTDWEMH